ncbi:protein-tyrosine phosphatase [Microbacteriaceae bacterium SG_E_30_P1]|uniref:protein-tyrosine-phosphatase n=1 Tax=Antiquaquibacter oligotrophicus TaxID=2880260 RepID=A0ABT6KPG2_9MICO|nr:hypothetical protein [Antiquaquibacter oligotrophicus]MDH6181691.1 protein-tyrosine phosphatase [Antiquaquibacter oligotrophicus]UDF12625.1 hypothetical protein LH407_10735 [Antiquaquibacter oligotrophicus]
MSESPVSAAERFSIVVVCTANICRSPIAERLLRRLLERDAPQLWSIQVSSAGTRATAGRALPDDTLVELERLGLPAQQHAAVPLDAATLATADLVLGLTRDHRKAAVRLAPRVATRAFTLAEYARILQFIRAERADVAPRLDGDVTAYLRELTALAARLRGSMAPQLSPDDLDIEDPYNRGTAVYRRVADSISASSTSIVDTLRSFA